MLGSIYKKKVGIATDKLNIAQKRLMELLKTEDPKKIEWHKKGVKAFPDFLNLVTGMFTLDEGSEITVAVKTMDQVFKCSISFFVFSVVILEPRPSMGPARGSQRIMKCQFNLKYRR